MLFCKNFRSLKKALLFKTVAEAKTIEAFFRFSFSFFRKEKRAEDFPLLFGLVHIVETVIAIITDAVNTPEISAAETISHLFDAIKRFIKNLRSAFYSVF